LRKVYKYPIHLTAENHLKVPIGGVVRHVNMQDDQMCLWIEVDLSKDSEFRTFGVFGTGHQIPEGWFYHGTVLDGAFIWHIYEEKGTNA
jgi:hypothetical protein